MTSLPESLCAWQVAWRRGIAPSLTDAELQSLRVGLLTNDQRLVQGCTVYPPPLMKNAGAVPEEACVLCYGAWMAGLAPTVAEAEERFAVLCFEADQRLGEPAGCRWFLNWFDDTPRQEMLVKLWGEVERELNARQQRAA